jgi:16S rRNA (uracil1498-N3)-methyltransferase
MRAGPGDRVVLFDGSGVELSAVVEALGRDRVELHVVGREEADRESSRQIVLGVALPKGQRQKYLVEKAVELGVQCLMPLRTERAVAQPDAGALDRLRRTVIEASKQCGRNRLMEIALPQTWPEFVGATRHEPHRLLAHLAPGESPGAKNQLPLTPGESPEAKVILAIGPEGGWTEAEVALAVADGWHTISLGRRILRVETAALALAARMMTD